MSTAISTVTIDILKEVCREAFSFGIGFGELGKQMKRSTLEVTSIELQGQEHWLGEISPSPFDQRTRWLLGNYRTLN